ncbi:MAG: redox-regulated ATPase YchF [Planctomycetes bacterium]|nr:redox-regulated ATPase YchF [Planctomycetota bacterium]
MKIALVGGFAAGKTTLLAALTGHEHAAAAASQAAGKPRDGHAKVPDVRVEKLAEKWKPKKSTYATLDFVDSQPLYFDGPEREKNRETLGALREADGLLVVIGDFDAAPAFADLEALAKSVGWFRSEFLLADLDSVEKRIEKLEVSTKRPTPFQAAELKELAVHRRYKDALEANQPVASVKLSIEEARLVKGFRFLSEKPLLVAYNAAEGRLGQKPYAAELTGRGIPTVELAARLELELLRMEESERASFMGDYGLASFGTHALVTKAYAALGLVSFLTMGEDECRAWTIHRGDDAVTAAGRIHTDLSKGFIAAEITAFADWEAVGGVLKEVKAQGKFRTEGRTYVMQDGDIMNVKFNV